MQWPPKFSSKPTNNSYTWTYTWGRDKFGTSMLVVGLPETKWNVRVLFATQRRWVIFNWRQDSKLFQGLIAIDPWRHENFMIYFSRYWQFFSSMSCCFNVSFGLSVSEKWGHTGPRGCKEDCGRQVDRRHAFLLHITVILPCVLFI